MYFFETLRARASRRRRRALHGPSSRPGSSARGHPGGGRGAGVRLERGADRPADRHCAAGGSPRGSRRRGAAGARGHSVEAGRGVPWRPTSPSCTTPWASTRPPPVSVVHDEVRRSSAPSPPRSRPRSRTTPTASRCPLLRSGIPFPRFHPARASTARPSRSRRRRFDASAGNAEGRTGLQHLERFPAPRVATRGRRRGEPMRPDPAVHRIAIRLLADLRARGRGDMPVTTLGHGPAVASERESEGLPIPGRPSGARPCLHHCIGLPASWDCSHPRAHWPVLLRSRVDPAGLEMQSHAIYYGSRTPSVVALSAGEQ